MTTFDEDDEKKRLKRYINILYHNAGSNPTALRTAIANYRDANPSDSAFCDALDRAVEKRSRRDEAGYNSELDSIRLQPDSLSNLHAHMVMKESALFTTTPLKGYSSDQWAQLINGADEAVSFADGVTGGIATAALKEVLGDNFPNNFAELALDQQEAIINSLSAPQIAKFHTKVLEKAQNLAELLPPHQLAFMAKNVDESLSASGLDDATKQSLQQQQTILRNAMKKLVNEFKAKELETNPENAAGVYDGAMEMLAYLEQKLPANELTPLKQNIDQIKRELDDSIKLYDESQGLKDVKSGDVKAIDKTYSSLVQNDVNAILSASDVPTAFTQLLDNDLKDIFNKIEFSDIPGENNQNVSADEAKKLFIQMIVSFAAQKTAVVAHGKSGNELKEEFKEQLNNAAAEEIIRLIGTEECLEVARDDLDKKKKTLKAYAAKLTTQPKFKISKDAFVGYAAAAVNRQSLFLNRLATKINNRSAAVLHKMYKPFQKADTFLTNILGRFYTIPKQIVKRQLTNLPWSIANAAVRVTAFTLAGTYGWPAYAGYAAYSIGTMVFRMYRASQMERHMNPQMSRWKAFRKHLGRNWSGVALGLAGTALSVIPGLGHTAGWSWAQETSSFLRDHGMMDQVTLGQGSTTSLLSKIGLMKQDGDLNFGITWGSVGLMGAGLLDSTVRGTLAAAKTGKKWYKALWPALGLSCLNTSFSVGTSIGCSYVANTGFNAGLNLCGDLKTGTHDAPPLDKDHPNYAESVRIEGIKDINHHLHECLSSEEFATCKETMHDLQSGNLSKADYDTKLEAMNNLLNKHGMTLSSPAEGESGDIKLSWQEQDGSRISDEAKTMAENAVKDWTKADPKVYSDNIKVLESVVEEYNKAHPDQPMDVHRFYRAMLETGCQAVEAGKDTWLGVDKDGHVSNAHGRHDVVTKGFLASPIDDKILNPDGTKTYGSHWELSGQDIDNIKAIAGADGRFDATKFTPETIAAIAKIEHHMQANGCIGSTEGTRGIGIGPNYLPSHAKTNDYGEVVNTETGATHMNTYANGKSAYEPHMVTRHAEFIMHQAQEQVCMFLNPAIDIFRIAQKKANSIYSRIMGRNPQKAKPKALQAQVLSGSVRA